MTPRQIVAAYAFHGAYLWIEPKRRKVMVQALDSHPIPPDLTAAASERHEGIYRYLERYPQVCGFCRAPHGPLHLLTVRPGMTFVSLCGLAYPTPGQIQPHNAKGRLCQKCVSAWTSRELASALEDYPLRVRP